MGDNLFFKKGFPHERLFCNVFDKSAVSDYLLNEGRERLCLIGFACGDVGDNACVEIYGYFITAFDLLGSGITFQYRQAYINSISVKNSCECRGDYTAYT